MQFLLLKQNSYKPNAKKCLPAGLTQHLMAVAMVLVGLGPVACTNEDPTTETPDDPCFVNGIDTCKTAEETLSLFINMDDEKQIIHSFGASDCWTTKFFGKWSDENKKNKIADLLFSRDTVADGSPVGIGLSMWRFNIGAGSYEQGSGSNIATDWRREECFLGSEGSYDWDKQEGQQWFLQAARQRGVKYILGFSLSPPVFMTFNGKAFNSSGGTSLNIQEGKLDEYADFLATVSNHFQFDYLSPVNEPQWAWGNENSANQEGTQAENQEISALATLLSEKVSTTKIVVAEAGTWGYLYGSNQDGRGDQIAQFFSPSSSNYIGDLAQVEHAISGHSYFTTCPDDIMIQVRQAVKAKIQDIDPALALWQSEFGILGDICGEYNGSPRNITIDYGLYVAKVLYHDLALANVSSWSWWLAVSPYNYSDALVYINDPTGSINVDMTKEDGMVLESKQLWAYGNYARFITPGMKRITATVEGIEDDISAANTLMISAYKDVETHKLVIVLVNVSRSKQKLQLPKEGSYAIDVINNRFNMYITDSKSNLKKSEVGTDNIELEPRSIVTLVGTYQ